MYTHPYLSEKLTEMVWILTHQILLDKNKRNFIEDKIYSRFFFSFEHSFCVKGAGCVGGSKAQNTQCRKQKLTAVIFVKSWISLEVLTIVTQKDFGVRDVEIGKLGE